VTPAPELLGVERLGRDLTRLLAAVGPVVTVPGWATVDLDRTTSDLAATFRDAEPDEVLGARCRIVRVTRDDAHGPSDVVLIEPSTEGLLAAALARHGEGPLALYLRADAAAARRTRQAGFALSPPAGGPLGRQQRVLVGPRDGPFLLLVGARLTR
jgi:hypothetical protein